MRHVARTVRLVLWLATHRIDRPGGTSALSAANVPSTGTRLRSAVMTNRSGSVASTGKNSSRCPRRSRRSRPRRTLNVTVRPRWKLDSDVARPSQATSDVRPRDCKGDQPMIRASARLALLACLGLAAASCANYPPRGWVIDNQSDTAVAVRLRITDNPSVTLSVPRNRLARSLHPRHER